MTHPAQNPRVQKHLETLKGVSALVDPAERTLVRQQTVSALRSEVLSWNRSMAAAGKAVRVPAGYRLTWRDVSLHPVRIHELFGGHYELLERGDTLGRFMRLWHEVGQVEPVGPKAFVARYRESARTVCSTLGSLQAAVDHLLTEKAR